MAAKARRAIADAEWVVTIQLEVKDEPVGVPVTLRYADSAVAKAPRNVGYLLSEFIEERAEVLKPGRKRK